jgi:hypothetical protein
LSLVNLPLYAVLVGRHGDLGSPFWLAMFGPGLSWLVGVTIPFSPGIWEKAQLDGFYEDKPKAMIYNKLQNLPESWQFNHSQYLGTYRSDSLQLLWD